MAKRKMISDSCDPLDYGFVLGNAPKGILVIKQEPTESMRQFRKEFQKGKR